MSKETDRELLIRIDERVRVTNEKLSQHVIDSKSFHGELQEKCEDIDKRLMKVELKQRPMFVKLFSAIVLFFKG